MKRYFLLACLAGVLGAAGVQAQVPMIGTTPTVDLGPNIAPTVTPIYGAEAKPGLVSRVSGWFGGRTDVSTVSGPTYQCVGATGCSGGPSCSSGERWDRFKMWLTYHSDNGKLLPCFRPTPYRPPLYNWFPVNEGCCAPGCGPWGCGGPPITYYYPNKEHPAPGPKLELHGPQTQYLGTGVAKSPIGKGTTMVPGFRLASAEVPGVPDRKRNTGVTPAAAVATSTAPNPAPPPVATAARPGEAPFGYYQRSFKKYDDQP